MRVVPDEYVGSRTGTDQQAFRRSIQIRTWDPEKRLEAIGPCQTEKHLQRGEVVVEHFRASHDLRRDRADRHRMRDVKLLNQFSHPHNIDFRHQHRCLALRDSRHQRIQMRCVVKQRQRPYQRCMFVRIDVPGPGFGMGEVFRMKTRNDFWHPRRAA